MALIFSHLYITSLLKIVSVYFKISGLKYRRIWIFSRAIVTTTLQERTGLGSPMRGRRVGSTRIDQLIEAGALPESLSGRDIAVQGRFADLPQKSSSSLRDLSLLLGLSYDLKEGTWFELHRHIKVYRNNVQSDQEDIFLIKP